MDSIADMSFAVVGAVHPNADGSNRQFEILLCQAGEPVTLVPEPENKHDRHAVAVYSSRDVQIGYISADRARLFGERLRGDEACAVFQRGGSFGAWIRVGFSGEAPRLTRAMLADPDHNDDPSYLDRGEPDFYPDEIWPDD